MLGKALSSLFQINLFGWVVLSTSFLMVTAIVFWTLFILEIPIYQFIFIVIFPVVFLVVIPVTAYFMFVHTHE